MCLVHVHTFHYEELLRVEEKSYSERPKLSQHGRKSVL